jgi:hypothetical protein
MHHRQVRTLTFDVEGEVSEAAVESWLEALLWESKLDGAEVQVSTTMWVTYVMFVAYLPNTCGRAWSC